MSTTIDQTRVMGSTLLGVNRTQVVPGGVNGATMQIPAGGMDAFRTQMGGTMSCPVCKSVSPLLDPWCGECGFLLTSAPVVEEEIPIEEAPAAELIDVISGRRYKLRAGLNTVGRQGTDILIDEGTVSRVHAKLTVENNELIVEDMGSSNGTKVGDSRLAPNKPTSATHGTPLKFGNWRVMLEIGTGIGTHNAERTIIVPEKDCTIIGNSSQDNAGISDSDIQLTDIQLMDEKADNSSSSIIAMLKKTSGTGNDISLPMGVVSIGRKPGNTVIYADDSYISGRHAEITTDELGTYLKDIGSTNGTVVNGQKMVAYEPQLLVVGDEVQLGQTKYSFVQISSTKSDSEVSEFHSEADIDIETENV